MPDTPETLEETKARLREKRRLAMQERRRRLGSEAELQQKRAAYAHKIAVAEGRDVRPYERVPEEQKPERQRAQVKTRTANWRARMTPEQQEERRRKDAERKRAAYYAKKSNPPA